MTDTVDLRPERESDFNQIRALVQAAFGSPIEAELVDMIRASPGYVPELSLVALVGGVVVGHVMLSYVSLENGDVTRPVLSLSPIAVHPSDQGRGIGTRLISEALRRAEERGEPLVCLEGSPAFYGRRGFEDSRRWGIFFDLPSWAPADAGQIYRLSRYAETIRGKVVYPTPFQIVEARRTEAGERLPE